MLCSINAELTQELLKRGVTATGFANPLAPDAFPLSGRLLTLPDPEAPGQMVDLGFVGEVTQVNRAALPNAVVVLPSLAHDGAGGWLNINADTAAGAVAGAMQAEACLFLTDTPGVLRTIHEPQSRFSRLTRAECQALQNEGIIAGGMIPKVEACLDALRAGATKAVILDGRDPHALLNRFATAEPVGTEIVP